MTTNAPTTVVIDAAGRGTYRWRCERCHRQSREKAATGRLRHVQYHAAMDRVSVQSSSEED